MTTGGTLVPVGSNNREAKPVGLCGSCFVRGNDISKASMEAGATVDLPRKTGDGLIPIAGEKEL